MDASFRGGVEELSSIEDADRLKGAELAVCTHADCKERDVAVVLPGPLIEKRSSRVFLREVFSISKKDDCVKFIELGLSWKSH